MHAGALVDRGQQRRRAATRSNSRNARSRVTRKPGVESIYGRTGAPAGARRAPTPCATNSRRRTRNIARRSNCSTPRAAARSRAGRAGARRLGQRLDECRQSAARARGDRHRVADDARALAQRAAHRQPHRPARAHPRPARRGTTEAEAEWARALELARARGNLPNIAARSYRRRPKSPRCRGSSTRRRVNCNSPRRRCARARCRPNHVLNTRFALTNAGAARRARQLARRHAPS